MVRDKKPESAIEGDEKKDDTELFEMIIFQLSPILGGRNEVLNTPFIEALKYLELFKKEKKAERWNRFMDNFYSSMPYIDSQKRKEYVESIQPEQARKQLKMKTDLDQLKALKSKQFKK